MTGFTVCATPLAVTRCDVPIVKHLYVFLASLGVASHITVTIAASDDAHGVFQFSLDSLSVNGTEPEEGRSTVLLQVSVCLCVSLCVSLCFSVCISESISDFQWGCVWV